MANTKNSLPFDIYNLINSQENVNRKIESIYGRTDCQPQE